MVHRERDHYNFYTLYGHRVVYTSPTRDFTFEFYVNIPPVTESVTGRNSLEIRVLLALRPQPRPSFGDNVGVVFSTENIILTFLKRVFEYSDSRPPTRVPDVTVYRVKTKFVVFFHVLHTRRRSIWTTRVHVSAIVNRAVKREKETIPREPLYLICLTTYRIFHYGCR